MSPSTVDTSAFGAAGSALGYLAQVDYALWAALERLDDEEDFSVSIETLDDVVFHDPGTGDATEKLQTKHTINQARSLSDASTDLWKTLGNWIAEPGDGRTRLVLLAVADAGTTATLLRAGVDRDVAAAQQRLEQTARASDSTANAQYYAAFLGLSDTDQRALLERVEIVDGAAPVAEMQGLLERAVRKSVKPQRRTALVDRLRGWWHKRAIAHLDAVARGEFDRISAGELEGELLELADTLRDENLPIDVLDMAEPTDQEVSERRAMPTVLSYLVAPLALHGPTRRALPVNVRAQMGEWIVAHPQAVLDLGRRATALRPLVSAGLRLALQHGLISGDESGLRAEPLGRRPQGMAGTAEVDECIAKSGFLGRWFSEQPDPITTLALWGVRP